MATDTLVSIVMPTYNRANFIAETIHSIQQQTHANWELIIIDDGSTDNTEAIVNSIADGRISYYNAGRIGISGKVKNIGLRKAKGNWIALMDSDDLWPTNKLVMQLHAMNNHPDASYSLTGGYNFKVQEQPFEIYYEGKSGMRYGYFFHEYCKAEIAALLQTLLFKKECLALAGYFEEDFPFTDFGFIGQLAYHFKGVILYDQLLYRRIHSENDSTANWDGYYHHFFKTLSHYKSSNMLDKGIAQSIIFDTYLHLGERYLGIGQKKKALHNFGLAWKAEKKPFVVLKKILKTIIG